MKNDDKKMNSAAVIADNYKLKIFRANLKEAGFEWTEQRYSKHATLLKVKYKTSDLDVLTGVITTSNAQAVRKGIQ